MKNSRGFSVLWKLMALPFCLTAFGAPADHAAKPQLVIIDTDIGDDIDDAYALALALKSPELKIVGVTTTFGDTHLRAALVERYLTAVGRNDIPILAGPPTRTSNVMTQAAYAKRAPEKKFGEGSQFIVRQAREHPGEITLIGIGPLSTIRHAIEVDPEGFRKLKRVVSWEAAFIEDMDSTGRANRNRPSRSGTF
jgi:inosine-uridine nucleoside N-ribohydrolase